MDRRIAAWMVTVEEGCDNLAEALEKGASEITAETLPLWGKRLMARRKSITPEKELWQFPDGSEAVILYPSGMLHVPVVDVL